MGMKRRRRDAMGMLARSHRKIEQHLDRLAAVTERVARGGATDADRGELADILAYFAKSGARHVEDEEASVFPRLRPHAPALVLRLIHEHREHDRVLARLERAAARLPEDATRLPAIAEKLAVVYRSHIEVEEDALFPAIERHLAGDLDAILDEMQARRGR